MAVEKLKRSLQENILTVLCMHDVEGRVAVSMVTADLFEGEYKIVAERVLNFWQIHKCAPKDHLGDLVDEFIHDPRNRRGPTFQRILQNIYELSEGINLKYVMQSLRTFVRLQRTKQVLIESIEKLQQNQEMALDEVEALWNTLLKARQIDFSGGMRLGDIERYLTWSEMRANEFTTGIRELDRNHIVPMRGAVILIISPAKRGKSWFCVQMGKQALHQRKKVLHISLEMPEEQVIGRYYQALFGIPRYRSEYWVTELVKKRGRLEDVMRDKHKPEFSMESPGIAHEITVRLTHGPGIRFDENLMVKSFPSGSLSMDQLEAHLDMLESTEHFIPDMLILDYLGITKIDLRNPRFSIGRNMTEFRGICDRRNIAGILPQQGSKASDDARVVHAKHVAEDWSAIGTADVILTYTHTKAEYELGLGRLFVDRGRSERGGFGVLLTQNYATGQFVLDSMMVPHGYLERVDDWAKQYKIEADADEEYLEEGD